MADSAKLTRVLQATAYLLRTCEEIDPYTYHDAPWSPIHDRDAEDELRAALKDYRPNLNGDRY